jgi:hypothetical protein
VQIPEAAACYSGRPRFPLNPGRGGDIVARTMTFKKTILLGSVAWLLLISALHAWLNLGLFRAAATQEKSFKVGFLPVT